MTEVSGPAARVRALCDFGLRSVEVDEHIPPNRYFKSGKEMIRMASVYEEEGELEKAFILYNKFTTLFIEKLPKHPNYKNSSKEDKQNTRKLLERIFPKAEALKTKLKEKYTAEENKQLAELKREEEEREKLRQLQQKAEEMRAKEEERRRQEMEVNLLRQSEDELRQLQLKEQEQRERQQQQALDQQWRISNSVSSVTTSEELPTLPPTLPSTLPPMPSAPPAAEPPVAESQSPPPNVLPPSYTSVVQVNQKPTMPSRDLKPTSTSMTRPEVDRTCKPFIDHFTSTGEAGLKTVFVPDDLVPLFLHCAMANSMRSIETCGILCGKLKNSQWHISHLLIPQQTGTTDSCDISNEEAVANFQDKHSLITLGWIHTHPTQTAFLSSVDQHTHWPYQKLLPEAIAIVCSPKFNETGYFYLTPDFGMDYVRNCNGRGFHEHPTNPPMFEKCPHVQLDKFSKVVVQDLRLHH